jgi:hypothetical protein
MPAEMLLVATSTMVHFLEKTTDYPVKNIDTVINAYRVARDNHLKSLGYNAKQINSFTETAIEALLSWLEDRAAEREGISDDFLRWANELLGEDGVTD